MTQINPVEIPKDKTQGAGQASLDQEQRNSCQCQFKAQGAGPETTKLRKN